MAIFEPDKIYDMWRCREHFRCYSSSHLTFENVRAAANGHGTSCECWQHTIVKLADRLEPLKGTDSAAPMFLVAVFSKDREPQPVLQHGYFTSWEAAEACVRKLDRGMLQDAYDEQRAKWHKLGRSYDQMMSYLDWFERTQPDHYKPVTVNLSSHNNEKVTVW